MMQDLLSVLGRDLFYPTFLKARSIKFIYSEKATKFCEILPLLLTTVHTVKSKGKISQNFMAFSEYMNFTRTLCRIPGSIDSDTAILGVAVAL